MDWTDIPVFTKHTILQAYDKNVIKSCPNIGLVNKLIEHCWRKITDENIVGLFNRPTMFKIACSTIRLLQKYLNHVRNTNRTGRLACMTITISNNPKEWPIYFNIRSLNMWSLLCLTNWTIKYIHKPEGFVNKAWLHSTFLHRIQVNQEKRKCLRTSSDFNENQPKHQNRNFLRTFCKHLWWNLYTTFI